jgi:hypothetical protein
MPHNLRVWTTICRQQAIHWSRSQICSYYRWV